jgi:hypothetical protein
MQYWRDYGLRTPTLLSFTRAEPLQIFFNTYAIWKGLDVYVAVQHNAWVSGAAPLQHALLASQA